MMWRILASVEHVQWDLELKRVVQHCRGHVRAEFQTLLPPSSGEHFSCPGFRLVGLGHGRVRHRWFSQRLGLVGDSALLVLFPLR